MRKLLPLTALVAALAWPVAEASIGPAPTLSELVREADLIVAGTVTDVRGVWAANRSGIYSFITLGDLDVIDGAYPGATLVLRQDGGEVTGLLGKKTKQVLTDVPEFTQGERVLLFVQNNGTAVCPLVGWRFGALRIKKDARGKERVLSWERGQEMAGVEGDRFLFKVAEPEAQPRIEPADASARQALAALEARRREAREAVRRRDFSYADLKRLLQAEARTLRESGTKKPRPVVSADPRNVPERRFSVAPPSARRPEKTP